MLSLRIINLTFPFMKHFPLAKTILTFIVMAFAATPWISAAKPINLAGIYEMNQKVDDGRRHIMYLELDFINGRPDFTQTFTTKESKFMLIPRDFMNAKKLKKTFQGTTAAGFGKSRLKNLVSLNDEFRITNPRKRSGVILADWDDSYGEKGKVIIIPQTDGSLITYGLTTYDDRALSPDGLRLQLVKSLLPAGGDNSNQPLDPSFTSAKSVKQREDIASICNFNFNDAVKKLEEMPDDNEDPAEKPASAPTEPTAPTAPVKEQPKTNGEINIELWGDNKPIQFMFHTIATGGDYGRFETNSALDFWSEDNGEIAMRMQATCVYETGRMYDINSIYYGRRKGNKIVFTRVFDENTGETSKPESYQAHELDIISPTQVVFDRCTYDKMDFDYSRNCWVKAK